MNPYLKALRDAAAPVRARASARVKAFGLGGAQNLSLAIGAVLVSHGVGRIYAPAGEIVAGICALAFAWILARATGA